jgi:hypothetical protein
MKISLRLAEQLGADANRHGVLAEIEKHSGVERHTVASWLNNTARYVSLDALGAVAGYLVKRGADKNLLPGALLGRDPEYFWDALASCKNLHFCLGTRVSPQWPGSDYVMSSDAHLQGRMLTEISNRVYRANGAVLRESRQRNQLGSIRHVAARRTPRGQEEAAQQEKGDGQRHGAAAEAAGRQQGLAHSLFPEFNLLAGPDRRLTAENAGEEWEQSKQAAVKLYDRFRAQPSSALIALASVKVNPIVEVMLAKAFSAEAFVSQDDVAKPGERNCPILFRYREKKDERWERDPQPPSCCGGLRLAAKTPAPRYGIYYETKTGRWKACVWEPASDDVAFLFYAYRPSNVQVEVACGGFSARATRCLTRKLDEITEQLGKPQFISESLHVGLYLIAFSFDPKDKNYTRDRDERECEFRVIPLDDKVLRRRLEHKRAARKRPAARMKTSLRKQ